MKKNGFTLVEMLVSIGLLAIIGVAIGISLNNTFKNEEETNYKYFVEKVKSSTNLLVSNDASIINDLDTNKSFEILKIDEIINEGYLKENTINPNTNEKISKDDNVRVYYSSDKELIIDYPYNLEEGDFLFANNLNVYYKEANDDTCYDGLNENGKLIIVDNEGNNKGIELVKTSDIIAYMEDGRECNADYINNLKLGTHKIKYKYKLNGNWLTTNRYLTIIAKKPVIDTFEIKYDPTSKTGTKLNLKIEDSKFNIKYCILNSAYNTTPKIKECNNNWKDVNGISKTITNEDYELRNYIKELGTDVKKFNITLFVKNDANEYVSQTNTFTIDSTPPEVSLTVESVGSVGNLAKGFDKDKYHSKEINVNIDAKDTESGIDGYCYIITSSKDEPGRSTCNYTTTNKKDFTLDAADGSGATRYIHIYVRDRANNDTYKMEEYKLYKKCDSVNKKSCSSSGCDEACGWGWETVTCTSTDIPFGTTCMDSDTDACYIKSCESNEGGSSGGCSNHHKYVGPGKSTPECQTMYPGINGIYYCGGCSTPACYITVCY